MRFEAALRTRITQFRHKMSPDIVLDRTASSIKKLPPILPYRKNPEIIPENHQTGLEYPSRLGRLTRPVGDCRDIIFRQHPRSFFQPDQVKDKKIAGF